MLKEEIKKKALSARDGLKLNERAEYSRIIFNRLIEDEHYKNAENVLVYASMGSEVITDEIITYSLNEGKKVFCPKITDKKNRVMEFVNINGLDDLKEGFFGIREPEITEKSLIFDNNVAHNQAIVIVPGVAFDYEGNRIGYGGGYYDRFLSKNINFYKAALSFGVQVFEETLPVEPHDIRLDAVITEE
ncbi:5-formyltetrahydrofolate cyclo-ligase [Butyrivibrio sp. YAB3001]|uniref:5-formyltetrahydrofolate cyclo-ligase n=1 Tax=Butyrivibrio sp. YAB3001 TaxID=1520812 RepID=UPI0008F65D0E|nr:5-formyltetrahydrofolate cyclo-ligase [Butyrivibrio sp. YAB3001]SFD02758.1 5-formyltetrahydrofolate cyclo-ligase [Butyrivibrio sp. YAB3001]